MSTTLYFASLVCPHRRVTTSDKNASASVLLDQLLFCVHVLVLMCGPGHLAVTASCTLIIEKSKIHQVAVLLVIFR